ncbi:MAG TPA: 30S ribosomal protein S21 [Candidatus Jacksonbacteria bacterium]|nr:MAG: hypothetical protein UX07_C0024G0006 [Parcubacteria group bacterium GW2011_GWA2_45_30]HCE86325.1 30S ribosomal protein S21 [Candidatus Jacksonbacteria bacterium]
MVEIRKKEGETQGAFLRRFSRSMQRSGVLIRARGNQFYEAKPTKRVMKERALRRIAAGKEREWLEKLGKLTKEEK